MEEKQLEILFKNFLATKGYPQGSLLSEVALRTSGEGTFRPDLVILDLTNKEYIGIIEFKTKVDGKVEVNTLGQFYKYFSLLGTKTIPAYIVFPIADDDFQILALTEKNTFEPISKEDFPIFETLSAIKQSEEKIKQRELKEKTLEEFELKKKRAKQSAYFSIVSIVIGVMASLIAIFAQQKGFVKSYKQPVYCCDSLELEYQTLSKEFAEFKIQIQKINQSKIEIDTIHGSPGLSQFGKRIEIIEKGISENPEKTLSILQLRQEIELLKKADDFAKEITQSKIDAIKNEMDLQNAWMLGILIAIFGTILSLIVPNLLPKRHEKND